MRLWQDSSGRLLTDEQVLRILSYEGSLKKALDKSDIVLISQANEQNAPSTRSGEHNLTLADYLALEERPIMTEIDIT